MIVVVIGQGEKEIAKAGNGKWEIEMGKLKWKIENGKLKTVVNCKSEMKFFR